jgi:hypothetical protein
MKPESPPLFYLMMRLNAVERQKFAERRRTMKAMDGVEERIVEIDGIWRLEYWRGDQKTGELLIEKKNAAL